MLNYGQNEDLATLSVTPAHHNLLVKGHNCQKNKTFHCADGEGKSKTKKDTGKGKGKKKKKSNDKEALEDSDDGDYEGLEVDYMSDESRLDPIPLYLQ